ADDMLELLQSAQVLLMVGLVELDQQDRGWCLALELVQRRPEYWDIARKLDEHAIDQFDADRQQMHDAARRFHRRAETSEMHGADGAPAEQRRKLQLDAGGKTERTFRADQYMREIDVVLARNQRVEIVATDP